MEQSPTNFFSSSSCPHGMGGILSVRKKSRCSFFVSVSSASNICKNDNNTPKRKVRSLSSRSMTALQLILNVVFHILSLYRKVDTLQYIWNIYIHIRTYSMCICICRQLLKCQELREDTKCMYLIMFLFNRKLLLA